jgi:hypothetical protein
MKYLKLISFNRQRCILLPLSRFVRLLAYKDSSGVISSLNFYFTDFDNQSYKIEIHDNCCDIQIEFEKFIVNDFQILELVCNF